MRYITDFTPQELRTHVAKVNQYLTDKYPQLFTSLPSLRTLTIFYQGRQLCLPLKSAEPFLLLRPDTTTYRQFIPQLEIHLRTILTLPSVLSLFPPQERSSSPSGAEFGSSAPVTDGLAVGLSSAPVPSASAEASSSAPVPSASPEVSSVPDGSAVGTLRPQHFDQYSHLLPQSFRDFYTYTLPILYSNRSDHHTHLRDLTLRTPDSSQSERAQLSRTIRNIDRYLSLFWRRVDAYYEIAIGRQVPQPLLDSLDRDFRLIGKSIHLPQKPCTAPTSPVPDAVGSCSVPGASAVGLSSVPSISAVAPSPHVLGGSAANLSKLSLADLQRLPDSEAKQEAIRSRIERNKKFLRRTDRKRTPETIDHMRLAAEELHTLGILITDKQAEVCAYYGYQVPTDWQEPPLSVRKAQQAQRKYDKAKAQRAQVRAQKLQAKQEALLDDPPLD